MKARLNYGTRFHSKKIMQSTIQTALLPIGKALKPGCSLAERLTTDQSRTGSTWMTVTIAGLT